MADLTDTTAALVARSTYANGRPRERSHKLSETDKASVVARFTGGEKVRALGEAFGIQPQSIRKMLKRRGICARDDWMDCWRINYRRDAFSVLDEETSYWIGVLMADGGIHNGAISVMAATKDSGHIERFRDFLQYEGNLIVVPPQPAPSGNLSTGGIRLTVSSRQMTKDLAGYGILPKKSLTASVLDDRLLLNRDFWRGVIDGDGSLGWHPGNDRGYRYPYLQLCGGSIALLDQFRAFVRHHLPKNRANVHRSKTIWLFRIAGTVASFMTTVLYEEAPISLERKKTIANEIIRHHHSLYMDELFP